MENIKDVFVKTCNKKVTLTAVMDKRTLENYQDKKYTSRKGKTGKLNVFWLTSKDKDEETYVMFAFIVEGMNVLRSSSILEFAQNGLEIIIETLNSFYYFKIEGDDSNVLESELFNTVGGSGLNLND